MSKQRPVDHGCRALSIRSSDPDAWAENLKALNDAAVEVLRKAMFPSLE
jgi:hypothetical protein